MQTTDRRRATDILGELAEDWGAHRTAGFVIAVLDRDGVSCTEARGYADASRERRLGAGTVFNLSCLSKQFIGLGVAMLEQARQLDAGDPIRRYLPELPACCDAIRVEHLIHHTSGVRNLSTLLWLAGRVGTPAEKAYALLVRQQELVHEPGARFMYSGTGYFLLSRIIERITGVMLGRWFDEWIFAPAGMRVSSLAEGDSSSVPAHASGFRYEAPADVLVPFTPCYADAGGFSTVDDLCRWDAYIAGAPGTSRGPLIQRLYTRGRLLSGLELPYAYGLSTHSTRGMPVIFHSAQGAGHSHMHVRLPGAGVSVIMLSNAEDGDAGRQAVQVLDAVAGTTLARELGPAMDTTRLLERPSRPLRDAVDLPEDCCVRYYSRECETTYRVDRAAGGIALGWGDLVLPLVRNASGEFEGKRLKARFARDASGRPTMTLRAWGVGEIRCESDAQCA